MPLQDANPTPSFGGFGLRERAKGGAGMVALGACTVHPTSTSYFENSDDRIIPRYQRIAELVHEYPVPVLAQLNHRGRTAGVNQREVLDGDWLSVAPSAVPTPSFSYVQAMPHEMDAHEVEEIVDAFGAATARVKAGGLDGVEIVVGYGGLISQFLHGQSNRRSDKYGGDSLEERMTFAYEVLRATRSALGPDLLLGVRISDDLVDYSINYEDSKTIVPLLEATGLLDYINVWIGAFPDTAATRGHWPPYYHEPGGVRRASRWDQTTGESARHRNWPDQHARPCGADAGRWEDGPRRHGTGADSRPAPAKQGKAGSYG